MPGIRAAFHDLHTPGTLSLTFRMPPNTLDNPTNDSKTPPLNEQAGDASILVFLSARCIGSVGFAVSLFAIWFGWLLPAAIMAPAPNPGSSEMNSSRLSSKPTRRATSAAPASRRLPKPVRRVSAPVDLTPILASPAEDTQLTSRHVYFADKDPSPIVRRNTMPEACKSNPTSHSIDQLIRDSLTLNSRFSSSAQPRTRCDSSIEETTLESDSSRHSSRTSLLRPSSRLHKLKLNFHSKSCRSEAQDKPGDQSSLASTETGASDKSARRASAGFVSPWTLTRNRTAPDVIAEPRTASPSRLSFRRRASPSRPSSSPAHCPTSAADILSPVFSSRKAQKRVSAPIPRTSPYGAPYFASPPIVSDNTYPSYLKTLPQFGDEFQGVPSRAASDGEDAEPARGRSCIRRVMLNPPQVLPKRRSASEDWTTQRMVS